MKRFWKYPQPAEEATWRQLFARRCKDRGLWGLAVCPASHDILELAKACPLLNPQSNDRHSQGVSDGMYFLFYETEAECNLAFRCVVGDDGPTDLNPYDGPEAVYALTCGPDGRPRSRNT